MMLLRALLLVPALALALAACGQTETSSESSGVAGARADSVAPTTPSSFTASAVGAATINLAWNASADNIGVTGYIVRRNGAQIATPTGTSYSDTGLAASTTYNYTVLALDAAGNASGAASASATTGTGGGDTTPPTAPGGFTATPAGASTINLQWNPSTDNVGVVAYVLRRNGTQIATPATTNYADTGLTPATTYNYSVAAFDAAGNVSTATNTSATTAAGGGDTTPPSTPAGLMATVTGASTIDLQWNASTDNVGVTGYIVRRNGTPVATPTGTTFADTGLSAATTYTYTVAARDAAGNTSSESTGVMATTNPAGGGALPLGALVHDGPATPEQISLLLPVTGALPQTATASVRYKPTSLSTWTTGHPLYRIRPSFSDSPATGNVPDAFAWPIIGLAPGTSYDVEVTVTSGATTNVRTLTHTTRALPAAAGAPNKTVAAGSSVQTAFNGLVAGDVLQLANGTYTVDGLNLDRSGTAANPIYIRGASRTGVILSDPTGTVLRLSNASHVVIENLTIQGSGVDSGTNASSRGIEFFDGSPTQTRVTIRNVIINGVDKGIVASSEIAEFLAHDNTLNGNNQWTSGFISSNLTWNDDGIRIPGFGNCAFNNTLRGFGDTLSVANHSGDDTLTENRGVHFYRNDVRNSTDDMVEADHSHRNVAIYDNRCHNCMTAVSFDPVYGGPVVYARNYAINVGRDKTVKVGAVSRTSGYFLYSNTTVSAATTPNNWQLYQAPDAGAQDSFGFRNNVFVFRGGGQYALVFDASGYSNVDFTHNSFFPNGDFYWEGASFGTLSAAQSGLGGTTPIFSGAQRHANDNITISNPWTVTVTLGANYLTEVTTAYVPTLSVGTTPKNSGAVIANITDGFSGAAPDRGAIIEGRAVLQYGDRTP